MTTDEKLATLRAAVKIFEDWPQAGTSYWLAEQTIDAAIHTQHVIDALEDIRSLETNDRGETAFACPNCGEAVPAGGPVYTTPATELVACCCGCHEAIAHSAS